MQGIKNQKKSASLESKGSLLNESVKSVSMIRIFCRSINESGEVCNTFLASSDGQQIFFDGKPLPFNPHYLIFDCPACRQTIKWRRKKKGVL